MNKIVFVEDDPEVGALIAAYLVVQGLDGNLLVRGTGTFMRSRIALATLPGYRGQR